tara:strand:+ start:941 stop:1333 length:393 start_codon:yes stop_codon:yes gene_type:complete
MTQPGPYEAPTPPGTYPPPAPGTHPGGYAPAYPAYPTYPTGPRTNSLAIVSLIASISAFVVLPFLGSLAGVITGHMALSQISRSGEQGRGLALAGLIVGYVGLGLVVLGIIAFALFWGFLFTAMSQAAYT